jgi:predicted  nucleic acid-binding Zn-ribbon protein
MKILKTLLQLQEIEFGKPQDKRVTLESSHLRTQIPGPILAHYDRLIARGKRGIALVHHQTCGGCHMLLPIGKINSLLHHDDIQLCENCGRYLYLPTTTHRNTTAASGEVVSG